MSARPFKIRQRKVRGEVEIVTYFKAARGAKRVAGKFRCDPSQLGKMLEDPAVLAELALPTKKPARI